MSALEADLGTPRTMKPSCMRTSSVPSGSISVDFSPRAIASSLDIEVRTGKTASLSFFAVLVGRTGVRFSLASVKPSCSSNRRTAASLWDSVSSPKEAFAANALSTIILHALVQ